MHDTTAVKTKDAEAISELAVVEVLLRPTDREPAFGVVLEVGPEDVYAVELVDARTARRSILRVPRGNLRVRHMV